MPKLTINRELKSNSVLFGSLERGDVFRLTEWPGAVCMKIETFKSHKGCVNLGNGNFYCLGDEHEVIPMSGTLDVKDA